MSGTLTPADPAGTDNGVSAPLTTPPPTDQEVSDQAEFDAVVNRDSKIVVQILAGVAILAAVIMSTVALARSGSTSSPAQTVTVTQPTLAAAVPGTATPPVITLSIAGSNKKGPDGKLHDSFSKTNFAVKVGQPTQLRINNTDSNPHSITSPATGVSIIIMPGVHTYTMTATTVGRFEWLCIIPCDSEAKGWAMTHPGYMAGFITAT